MTREFPSILVVTSNNFNLVTGGGITLTNLFRGWPIERIANLHEDPTPEDHSVCKNFYRLSDEEIRWYWPFSFIRPWHGLLKGDPGRTPRNITELEPDPKRGLGAMKRALGGSVPKYAYLTDRLLAWLDDFQPTLLYAFLGSLEQIDLTRRLVDRLRVPLVVHMMDDWPAVLYTNGWLAPVVGPLLRRRLREVLARAAVRMAICEPMCREYQTRYGYPFVSFQNALETERWLPGSRTQWKAGSPFIIRYIGSIIPNAQKAGVQDVAQAVAHLAATGTAVRLEVYAPRHESAYLHADGFPSQALALHGPPDPEAIVELLAGADLLVLPYNFEAESARYVRLSMPTKAPAYMMSGTPILVYAPADLATAEYASREGWGYVLSHPGPLNVMEALKTLIDDESLRARLGQRAKDVAVRKHDAALVRAAFWDSLCAAAGRHPARSG